MLARGRRCFPLLLTLLLPRTSALFQATARHLCHIIALEPTKLPSLQCPCVFRVWQHANPRGMQRARKVGSRAQP